MSPIQCIGNVDEILCVLATGNAHKIVPYTISGNFQEMYKFHVVRNVHTMNRKCGLHISGHFTTQEIQDFFQCKVRKQVAS